MTEWILLFKRFFGIRRKPRLYVGPPDYTRRMILELDQYDYRDIQKAIARRQAFRCWPDPPKEWDAGESNLSGLALAEICRGWMEFCDASKKRRDNDATESES